jgi:TRAP-type transport system periplasmic protein
MKTIIKLSIVFSFFLLANLGLTVSELVAGDKPNYVIRFCSEGTMEMPWTSVGVKFGEILEKMTDGDVKVVTFPNSTLAGGGKAVDMLNVGSIQMYVDAPGVFSNVYAPFDIYEMPYLFDDLDQANRALDSKASQEMLEEFRKVSGLRVLGGLNHGFRQTTTNKPIYSIEDLKGIKMRVSPIPLSLSLWKALGTKPTPLEFSELYTSLATGVVDAQENPMFVVEMVKFHEVVKYLNLTDHQVLFAFWVVNDTFFKSLPFEYQVKAQEAMNQAVIWGREEVRKAEDGYMKRLEENGMTVIKTDKTGFVKASKDIYKQFLDRFDEKVFTALKNIK